jgi:hypothetical protein
VFADRWNELSNHPQGFEWTRQRMRRREIVNDVMRCDPLLGPFCASHKDPDIVTCVGPRARKSQSNALDTSGAKAV